MDRDSFLSKTGHQCIQSIPRATKQEGFEAEAVKLLYKTSHETAQTMKNMPRYLTAKGTVQHRQGTGARTAGKQVLT